jgi:succinate dehydrogenase/fumarate reductase flavoprotein subunit
MEISSLYPQQTATLESGVEDRVAISRQAVQAPQNQENQTAAGEDKVELVTSQNLASPPPEEVDVDQALQLLQQVQQDLGNFSRQDLRELYQFDRLRDLCTQVQMTQF